MTSPNLRDTVQALVDALERAQKHHSTTSFPLAIENYGSVEAMASEGRALWRGTIPAVLEAGRALLSSLPSEAPAQQAAPSGPTLTDEEATDIVQGVVRESARPIGMVAFGVLVARAVLARVAAPTVQAADSETNMGKRSTSAATANGHGLPDDTAAQAASLSVANGGDARVASAGCARHLAEQRVIRAAQAWGDTDSRDGWDPISGTWRSFTAEQLRADRLAVARAVVEQAIDIVAMFGGSVEIEAAIRSLASEGESNA